MSLDIARNRRTIIIALLFVFMLVALWIRSLPAAYLVRDGVTVVIGSDTWYTLRQIEAMAAHYPLYSWFDPMTAYPTGKEIGWGPLFPFIAATACVLTGATARPDFVYVAAWIPPVMAAAMVPVIYLLGRQLESWKTGIVAAGLIPFVSLAFYYRSVFGFVDHHVSEVLFSTLFCLCYIAALGYASGLSFPSPDRAVLRNAFLLSAAAGVAYLLGLLNAPTMILFALIAGAFTVLQFVREHGEGRHGEYLLLVNGVAFGIPALYMLLFGVKTDVLSFTTYSVAHPIAYLMLIAATAVLYALSRVLAGKRWEYPAAIGALGIGSIVLLGVVDPVLSGMFWQNLTTFFGTVHETSLIREMEPWNAALAWTSLNYGLILLVGGLGVLGYRTLKSTRPESLFVLVWSALILVAAVQHIRYEYYLSAVVALLAALVIAAAVEYGGRETIGYLRGLSGGETEKQSKGSKKKKATNDAPYGKMATLSVVIVLAAAFVVTSAGNDITLGSHAESTAIVSNEWQETLEWLGTHTPDPGVDVLGVYEKETFQYPEQAYGVMAWWDFGHWITYLAGRIPNTNPFQDNVVGPGGAATFFMATTEDEAEDAVGVAGSRYIITDGRTMTGKFATIASWINPGAGMRPYARGFLPPNAAQTEGQKIAWVYDAPYYHTMATRLQILDGSMTEPSEAYCVAYDNSTLATRGYPQIRQVFRGPLDEIREKAEVYALSAPSGQGAVVLSDSPARPLDTVPALGHYRLIYESSADVATSIKVFEHVPGAVVKGDGVVELPLVTNSGRAFTYRQQSVNGTFVLPYATESENGGVRATGPYRIAGTDTSFTVTEEAVLSG
ncbi:oligosaccharyl transferase, archaeosortase A system-associated [Methanofollis sp. UBA420]|jgi:dolichyl-diphosphooligosaccharide--protein glycosyltransferase|uniref:oligosaccharyl transferase, archaeosortase A system-associated n=1 Tax=Methanofollis sp. UBA420 TaxID=1915514 RepID=UPI00316AE361